MGEAAKGLGQSVQGSRSGTTDPRHAGAPRVGLRTQRLAEAWSLMLSAPVESPGMQKDVPLSRNASAWLLMLLVLALLVGTLMPGSWRDAGTSPFPSYLRVTTLAHAVLFAAITFVARISGLAGAKAGRLLAAAAALAASTGLLQLLAGGLRARRRQAPSGPG